MPRQRNTRGEWSTTPKHVVDEGIRPYLRRRRGKASEKGYQILWTCGRGHRHKEWLRYLEEARARREDQRAKARYDPAWCPREEQRAIRAARRVEEARERSRVPFGEYADRYLKWAEHAHRSYGNTRCQVEAIKAAFAGKKLDEITTADVEAYLNRLRDGQSPSERKLSPATVKRYRDRLSGMFRQAVRWMLVTTNPVTGIDKAKEAGERVLYLTAEQEQAIYDALPVEERPRFVASVYSGMRWSEQARLRWRDVDLHAGVITVPLSKHGRPRNVVINSRLRDVLFDLSLKRRTPDDRDEPVFPPRYTQPDKFFPKAVEQAQAALRAAGKNAEAAGLQGYTWHGNRHTFGARLGMSGANEATIMALGGWRSSAVVKRYVHLSKDYLRQAAEAVTAFAPRSSTLHSHYTEAPATEAAAPQVLDAPVAQMDRASDF
jgi:integrase